MPMRIDPPIAATSSRIMPIRIASHFQSSAERGSQLTRRSSQRRPAGCLDVGFVFMIFDCSRRGSPLRCANESAFKKLFSVADHWTISIFKLICREVKGLRRFLAGCSVFHLDSQSDEVPAILTKGQIGRSAVVSVVVVADEYGSIHGSFRIRAYCARDTGFR